MSAPTTLQEHLLQVVKSELEDVLSSKSVEDRNTERLEVLEGCASILGGWSLKKYLTQTNQKHSRKYNREKILQLSNRIRTLPIHHAIALSVLATADKSHHDRRSAGAYHTDFRLATYLADEITICKIGTDNLPRVIDPAVGPGILLVTVALALLNKGHRIEKVLADSLYGVDRSPLAVRGCLLALSSLTDSIEPIGVLFKHLRVTDSLTVSKSFWADLSPLGFDAVIGNPPWEKLKLNVHEHLKTFNFDHQYGNEISKIPSTLLYTTSKQNIKRYTAQVSKGTALQGTGEADLYKLFLELAQNLASPNGVIAMFVPAGLIRSQGTKELRKSIFSAGQEIVIDIFDNSAKFFGIDTRFKFLALFVTRKNNQKLPTITVRHSHGTEKNVVRGEAATIPLGFLEELRPDLSLPEVRSQSEWKLFSRISNANKQFGYMPSPWAHRFYREVDMTLDRNKFKRPPKGGLLNPSILPVVEGRMVNQFQVGVKRYVSGTGRSACWEHSQPGSVSELQPQFTIEAAELNPEIKFISTRDRVAFCDISGQTNERTMQAAMIPSGAVCGNKVPSIYFTSKEPRENYEYIWLALANSFIFDWLLRRLVTTTVNFFILDSVPIPDPRRCSSRMASIAADLVQRKHKEGTREYAQARAQLDAFAAFAYGVSPFDLDLILEDFDLLDRGQPPIPGEKKSTITSDLVKLALSREMKLSYNQIRIHKSRVDKAYAQGAIAYMPSQRGRNLEYQITDFEVAR